jgi:hypothetical protein
MFKKEDGDWTQYQRLPGLVEEVDFHRSNEDRHPEDRDQGHIPYAAKMGAVYHDALQALEDAQERGARWVIFIHGKSTSRRGKETAQSVVRGLMKSDAAKPFIDRSECIEHPTVFVAAIRPKDCPSPAPATENQPS